MKNKIIIIHTITRLDIGGAQDHLYELIRGLNSDLFKHIIITGRGGHWLRRFQQLNAEIIINPYMIRSINPLMDLAALWRSVHILRLLKKRYIHFILHSNTPKAGMIFRIAGYVCNIHPNIFTVHGWSFYDSQKNILKHLIILTEKILSRITDIFISVCRENINIALHNGIDMGNAEIIYSGIDYKRFVRLKRHITDTNIIGTITNFKRMKHIDIFVHVAHRIHKEFPHIKFIIIGDGPERWKIEQMIEEYEMKESIIITGFTEHVEHYMKDLDLILFTSMWEGLPRVLIQAYIMNIPFISFPAGGIGELADMAGISDYVSSDFNVDELYKIIYKYLNNKSRIEFPKSDIFTSLTMCNQHKQIYLHNAKIRK